MSDAGAVTRYRSSDLLDECSAADVYDDDLDGCDGCDDGLSWSVSDCLDWAVLPQQWALKTETYVADYSYSSQNLFVE